MNTPEAVRGDLSLCSQQLLLSLLTLPVSPLEVVREDVLVSASVVVVVTVVVVVVAVTVVVEVVTVVGGGDVGGEEVI